MFQSIFNDSESRTVWETIKNKNQIQELNEYTDLQLSYQSGSSLKFSIFRISKTQIVELDKNKSPTRALNLSLSTFEPFLEEKPSGPLYGFHLNSDIFYTSSEADLEKCIILLKSSCILTNFEEDFVILKQIGKGSTAIVYLCECVERSKQYAVKKVEKKTLIKQQSLLNLASEIQIYRNIEHPNICKLFFVYEDSLSVYLVLEYLPFGSLLQRISEKNRFTEKESRIFTKKLLETLEFMHCRNIVHRDLKLENILMTGPENCEFKLIDLGLAYESHFLQNKKCGSPGYVAPEMLRDEDYDCKIDIFAAGIILYILLHGRHPFEARNLTKMLNKNLECKIKPNKKLSREAIEVISLMTEPLQELRPSSIQLLDHRWFEGWKPSLLHSSSLIATLNSSQAVPSNQPP
jgi:serine/threonine protein kinase